jgi:hypothetical protein
MSPGCASPWRDRLHLKARKLGLSRKIVKSPPFAPRHVPIGAAIGVRKEGAVWLTLAMCVIWLALVARVLFRHDRIGPIKEVRG